MMAPVSRPVVIAAGGTGGHFFPAEALAAALLARGQRVVLLTDARSGGLGSAVFAAAETHVIAGAGLSGRNVWRAAQGGVAMLRGFVQAGGLMRALAPGVVVAFGGYPAVAPVLAARRLRARPPVILHEQNAVLGRANRLLARLADTLVLSFANTKAVPKRASTMVLGNPVRPAIAALHGRGYAAPADTINLLVLGGSLGAKIVGTLIPEALAILRADLRDRLSLTMQCRAEESNAARRVLQIAGIAAELSPFFTDMAAKLAAAHLVIARAGASTVAEVAAAGKPALFIPLPGAIDDHQRANAEALAAAGAAWRQDQAGLTPEVLARRIESILMAPAMLATAAAASGQCGRPDAAERLADAVMAAMPAGAPA